MNDAEVYGKWLRAYNAYDNALINGRIPPSIFDKAVANMEEILDMADWTVERWAAAAESWQNDGK